MSARPTHQYYLRSIDYIVLGRPMNRPRAIQWLAQRDIDIIRALRRHCRKFIGLVQTTICDPGTLALPETFILMMTCTAMTTAQHVVF